MSDTFSALIVREQEDVVQDNASKVATSIETLNLSDLPEGDILIRVEYSSLNYKDALVCHGERSIAPNLPHVPGIDLAGVVEQSDSAKHKPGDKVLVTGYDLGGVRWGGYSELVRVPAEWIVPLPAGFSAEQAMIFGTAGFTAAQCVMAVSSKVKPDQGQVVVTGGTGGVGSLAIAMLVHLGYEVVAVSGKQQFKEVLQKMGAKEVLDREALISNTKRPLLSATWAAAIDTVGGEPLTTLIRSIKHRGVVAACGLVAGADLPLTVYPFLLRGVTLAGIDSANCPAEPRQEIWQKLTGPWQVSLPEELLTTITLDEVPDQAAKMLQGKAHGRTLIRVKS